MKQELHTVEVLEIISSTNSLCSRELSAQHVVIKVNNLTVVSISTTNYGESYGTEPTFEWNELIARRCVVDFVSSDRQHDSYLHDPEYDNVLQKDILLFFDHQVVSYLNYNHKIVY